MTASERLTSALADRYRIERELGAGGMAISRQPSAGSRQRLRDFVERAVLYV